MPSKIIVENEVVCDSESGDHLRKKFCATFEEVIRAEAALDQARQQHEAAKQALVARTTAES